MRWGIFAVFMALLAGITLAEPVPIAKGGGGRVSGGFLSGSHFSSSPRPKSGPSSSFSKGDFRSSKPKGSKTDKIAHYGGYYQPPPPHHHHKQNGTTVKYTNDAMKGSDRIEAIAWIVFVVFVIASLWHGMNV